MERFSLEIKNSPLTKRAFYSPLSVNHVISITDDKRGIAKSLAEKFNQQSYRATVVTEVPDYTDALILLDGCQSFHSIDEAIAVNLAAFQQVKRIAKRFSSRGGILITVQNTGGNFAINSKELNHNVWSAGLTGLVKTAALEWPLAFCKAIDVAINHQSIDAIASQIFNEIIHGGELIECGLWEEERLTLSLKAKKMQEGNLRLDQKSVILITGGGRGITAACLIELAKKTPASFVLIGRTPLEEINCVETDEAKMFNHLLAQDKALGIYSTIKEINKRVSSIKSIQQINKTLKALNDIPVKSAYFCVDILDDVNVQLAFDQIRKKFGPIHGIIHGAGVLADKLIIEQTDQQFNYVFNTKVMGLKNILRATENDPLKLIIFFSSIAARFGNIGQCAYAMGNEILNKVAQYQRKTRSAECLIKSFNWGPWEIGMVNESLKNKFVKAGITLISEAEGTRHFIDELSALNNDVEVIVGDSQKRNFQ